jgi:WD40 repeat protein
VRVQQPDGSTEEQLGSFVEPVQLQVVCRRLWSRLPSSATQIVDGDLEAVGDVDTALADYYAERVAAIATQTGVRERVIREWVDQHLITEQGIRGQVLQGPGQSQGLDNLAIWPLVDAHLVRAEKGRGATWFELVHDRLIEPVRLDNAAWREVHLSALQRRAALWESHKRPNDLLLRDQALVEAEDWAAGHVDELTAVEREFVAACRDDRERTIKEQRQARRIRWLAVGATVFGIVAVILALLAWSQWVATDAERNRADRERDRAVLAAQEEATAKAETEASLHAAETAEAVADEERERAVDLAEAEATARGQAERQRRVAQARALAVYAETVDNPELAALVALEAVNQTHRDQHGTMTAEAVRAVHLAIGRSRWLATLGYHRRSVLYAEWSSDDARVVTAGEDGMGVVWDAATGESLSILLGHGCNEFDQCSVYHATWSPDDARIVSSGEDGTARVWDAATGTELLTFGGHGCDDIGQCAVVRAAWSADGQRVVTAGDDNTARVWNPATGKELLMLSAHRNSVNHVAWSPDEGRILTASVDGSTRVWDATTGAELLALVGNVGMIEHAAWSSDGTRIATAGHEGGGEVWDATTGKLLSSLQGHVRDLTHVAWSPDDTRIVTTSWDGTARVWDARNGVETVTLRGHTGWVWNAAWSPDGTLLVTAGNDGVPRVWDATSGAELFTLGGCPSRNYHAAWSSDGTRLLVSCGDGSARVWDAVKNVDPFTLRGHADSVGHAAWSPDGTRIVTVATDNMAKVWDAATGAELLTLSGHTDYVNHAAWSSSGKWIVTVSDDTMAKIWDAATGEMVANAEGHDGSIEHVAWSPDDTRILTASYDKTAKVWDLRTGKALTLAGHTDSLEYASWSPDGTRILTAGWDDIARVWDAATGAELFSLSGHDERVTHALWSPDGKRIATGDWSETARVWDSSTGAEILALSVEWGGGEHAAWSPDGTRILTEDGMWDAATGAQLFTIGGSVSESAWSPDGKQTVTTGSDSASVWDATTGAELFVLRGHTELIEHAAWSPDGTRIVTASADGTARIYVVRIDGPGGLVELACARTGRNLDYWEWAEYVGDELYYPTCPNLPPPASALRGLLENAEAIAEEGDLEKAETFARHAFQLAVEVEEPWASNQVCWSGSIGGFAEIVLPACEQAVELADETERAYYSDSRGLARALTGDYAGALEDFRVFMEWSKLNDAYERYGAKREAWIQELEGGRNPFDEETLEALRNE